jgi:polyhydroxyalkanoate synthesis repressor PhaR
MLKQSLGMAEPTGAKKLEIKKYPNRRYYDATHSRHLTLEEIRSLIQQGYDIRVLDAKSGADITAQVLTQIILELDTPKLDSLPVPLLVRLIRMNDLLIKDFIDKYFNQALKSFSEYQQQLEEQLRRSHGLPPVLPAVSAWTKAMLEPFAAHSGPHHRETKPLRQQPHRNRISLNGQRTSAGSRPVENKAAADSEQASPQGQVIPIRATPKDCTGEIAPKCRHAVQVGATEIAEPEICVRPVRIVELNFTEIGSGEVTIDNFCIGHHSATI